MVRVLPHKRAAAVGQNRGRGQEDQGVAAGGAGGTAGRGLCQAGAAEGEQGEQALCRWGALWLAIP
jgi:hypothetical protein